MQTEIQLQGRTYKTQKLEKDWAILNTILYVRIGIELGKLEEIR